MACSEVLDPSLKACFRLLPLYSSSLILEKVITLASTAIPIPRTKAAIPGRVNTPPINQKIKNTKKVYRTIATLEINPAK